MKKALLLLLAVSIFSTLAYARSKKFEGMVIYVSDGDTIVVKPSDKGHEVKCRLYGIDAPEVAHEGKPGQPFGEEAADVLEKMVGGKTVKVELTGERSYDREICRVTLDGWDVNREMIRRGLAWAYVKHLKRSYKKSYIATEEEARKKGEGLWSAGDVLSPWDFKKEYWNLDPAPSIKE